MSARVLAVTGLLSLLPISELRGAIPYGLANGLSIPTAFVFCVVLNALVCPFVYFFLRTVHGLFSRIGWYRSFFDKVVERARVKVKSKVDRFGYLGIALFVAVPLPITGAYTGTLGAWILGMDPKKTFLAVLAGVVIAGIVVTVVTLLGIEVLSIFVKEI